MQKHRHYNPQITIAAIDNPRNEEEMKNHISLRVILIFFILLMVSSCIFVNQSPTPSPLGISTATIGNIPPPSPTVSPIFKSPSPTEIAISTPLEVMTFPALSPGQYLVYSFDGALNAISLDGKTHQKLANQNGIPVSPDGSHILYQEAIYDLRNGTNQDVSFLQGIGCGVWSGSPDGKYLTLECQDGELYAISLNDKSKILLSKHITPYDHFQSPTWSPDGKWISYIRITPDSAKNFGFGDIQLLLVDTTCIVDRLKCEEMTREPISSDFFASPSPYSWSPDSRYIAIPSFSSNNSSILIYDIETDSINAIHTDAITINSTAWSPDGKWLAIVQPNEEIGNADDVYIISVNGWEKRKLVSSEGDKRVYSDVLFWISVP
jgi:Tol biopolymer transport system component